MNTSARQIAAEKADQMVTAPALSTPSPPASLTAPTREQTPAPADSTIVFQPINDRVSLQQQDTSPRLSDGKGVTAAQSHRVTKSVSGLVPCSSAAAASTSAVCTTAPADGGVTLSATALVNGPFATTDPVSVAVALAAQSDSASDDIMNNSSSSSTYVTSYVDDDGNTRENTSETSESFATPPHGTVAAAGADADAVEADADATDDEDSHAMLTDDTSHSAASGRAHQMIDSDSIKRYIRILGHLDYVYCVIFDRTGTFVITGADDKLIKIWKASTGVLVATLRGHRSAITDLDINFENTLLVSGAVDHKVIVWNLKTSAFVTEFSSHIGTVANVRFSPYAFSSTRWLVSSGADGFLCFWKYSAEQPIFKDAEAFKFTENEKIAAIAFSAGGSVLAIGKQEGRIVLYYLDDVKPVPLRRYQASHTQEVNCVQFANRSLSFLSASKDGTIRLWRHESSDKWTSTLSDTRVKLRGTVKPKVTMCIWNCDDSYVIAAVSISAEQSLLTVWRPSGSLVRILDKQHHTYKVWSLEAHHTNPHLVLSGSHGGNIILWNIKSGLVVKKFFNGTGEKEGKDIYGINDLKWSPVSNMFAGVDSHGHMVLYGDEEAAQSRYAATPDEQFFHLDYRKTFKNSRFNFLVDQDTSMLPHLMPPPFLFDSESKPFDLPVQRLVAGHEDLCDAVFNSIVGKTDREELVQVDNTRYVKTTRFDLLEAEAPPKKSSKSADDEADPKVWLKDIVQPIERSQLERSQETRVQHLEREKKSMDIDVTKIEVDNVPKRNVQRARRFSLMPEATKGLQRRSRNSLQVSREPLNGSPQSASKKRGSTQSLGQTSSTKRQKEEILILDDSDLYTREDTLGFEAD